MSLKEDIVKWFDGQNKWPGDMDGDNPGQVDCVLIEDELSDTSRWAVQHEATYLRKTIVGRDPLTFRDEYVTVVYAEPATEMQEWDDFDAPEVYEVEPVEIIITKFRRVE